MQRDIRAPPAALLDACLDRKIGKRPTWLDYPANQIVTRIEDSKHVWPRTLYKQGFRGVTSSENYSGDSDLE